MRRALALAALGVAFAWPMQVNGYNQNAHYALVRALAVYGTPNIDKTRGEIGDVSTGDVARYKGHVYAAKAPGLAFVSVPAFLVLKAVGMRTTGDPTRVIWALHLWSIVLPALIMIVLVGRVADRLVPGSATTVAVTVGVATLLLPFATLFFSHVLAAAFAFAAFAVLVRERAEPERLPLVAGAGVLAGLAVCTDYPLALAGAIVGLYAIARGTWWRRGLVYAAGVFVGLVPLLAFNWWAFGTPTHIAYEDYYAGGKHAGGTFGFGRPSLTHMHDLLFSTMGILVLTPVVAAAVVGAALLARRRRAEAAVALGVIAAYYVWNSSLRYASAFGGLGPPRYLFPLIPFLGVGLVCAWRRFPVTTLALALVSAFQMVATTATGPLAAYDGDWIHRARAKEFVQSASAIVNVTGWYAIVVFLGACAIAAWVGWSRVRGTLVDSAFALGAVAAWAIVALAANNPNGRTLTAGYVLALALAAALAAALVGRTFTLRRAPRPAAEAG